LEENGPVGKVFDSIDDRLATWITSQPVFFVATAPLASAGLVNCSPKRNRDEFVVLGPQTVAYLDQTGSGIETIAHLRENGRIVVMLCAFEGPPRIVRLHGEGRAVPVDTADFAKLATDFPGAAGVGVRSIIVIEVSRISDSCGYGVPMMTLKEHRSTMDQWSTRQGIGGIHEYWSEKNRLSVDELDGLDLP
jgi:hypothetical protein